MSQLSDFITQARAYGMSDDQIRQQLIAAGWSTEQVALELPASPAVTVDPATPAGVVVVAETALRTQPQSVVKAPSRIAAISLALVCSLLQVGGVGAAYLGVGESGYAPAISRTYRSTALPLALGRQNNNAAIAVAMSLQALAKQPGLHTETDYELVISAPANAVTGTIRNPKLVESLLAAERRYARVRNVAQSPLERFFANTSPDTEVTYPIVLTGNVSVTNKGDDVAARYTLDTAQLFRSLPGTVLDYLNPNFSEASIEGRSISSGPKITLAARTNILPGRSTTIAQQWYGTSIDRPAVLPTTNSGETDRGAFLEELLSSADQNQLLKLQQELQNLTTDLGVRKSSTGNVTVNAYRIAANGTQLRTLLQELGSATEPATDQLRDSDVLRITLETDARTKLPHTISIQSLSTNPDISPELGNATVTVTTRFAYDDASTQIARLATSDIATDIGPEIEYVLQQATYPDYLGILSASGIDLLRSFFAETEQSEAEPEISIEDSELFL
jgi:hypothetical protein